MMKALENLTDRITVNYENKLCYDIVFSHSFDNICKELLQFNLDNKRVCIVTESNVGPLYAHQLKQVIEPLCKLVVIHQFEAGENNKNLQTVNGIYETLISNQFDRNDMLFALGGGVVGDITGFAAATYLRGIDFIQVPTTLLSQVDSSIGGKTGVDFDSYKNMVGAFYMPKLVFMNLSTLNSLPKREYLSGMGEVIKHGLIRDSEYFNWILDNKEQIIAKDFETLKKLLFVSCNIKRVVVENDPKERSERALLNFGHTIGHAIEKLKDFQLLHGECVAIGLSAASFISQSLGKITMDAYQSINKCILDFNLPICTKDLNPDDVIKTILNDKKMDSGIIKFIVLEKVGNGVIDRTLSRETILDGINSVICNQ